MLFLLQKHKGNDSMSKRILLVFMLMITMASCVKSESAEILLRVNHVAQPNVQVLSYDKDAGLKSGEFFSFNAYQEFEGFAKRHIYGASLPRIKNYDETYFIGKSIFAYLVDSSSSVFYVPSHSVETMSGTTLYIMEISAEARTADLIPLIILIEDAQSYGLASGNIQVEIVKVVNK